jgi:pimeloyl-ACP methyl ester carboxylesterase
MFTVFKWIGTALAFWGVLLVLAFVFQRRLIYVPPRANLQAVQEMAAQWGFEPWVNEHQAYAGIRGKAFGRPRGTVILFHGNAELAIGMADLALFLRQNGFDTFVPEYPGYPGVPGPPSIKRIQTHLKQQATELEDTVQKPVILLGRSLGAAAALSVVSEWKPQALVLISPFDRLVSVAKTHYFYFFPQVLLRERWDNIQASQTLSLPWLAIHGQNDWIIPLALGRALHEAYPGPTKFFHVIPNAGHNDLYQGAALAEVQRLILEFLNRMDGIFGND